MIKHLDHIGIAVKSIKKSNELFESLLNTNSYKEEVVESENVKTSFFKVGESESKIELLEGLNDDNAITKFIEKKGEGIHHIAFEVEDIEKAIATMQERGFKMIHEKPKQGADGKLIAFLHPKSTNGVLVELCMSKEVKN